MKKVFKQAAVALAVGMLAASAHAAITTDDGVTADNNNGVTVINSLSGSNTSINSGNNLNLTATSGVKITNTTGLGSDATYSNINTGIEISSPQSVVIVGDNNGNSPGDQGVRIYSNGNADARLVLEGSNSALTSAGTTTINGAATNINTTGSGNVTIGNAANTTSLNSGTNNIGAGYASINNMGTGAVATTNSIGNNVAGTTVTSTAGNASQALSNNIATTNVTGGTSSLTNPTGGTSSQVRISNSNGATVDANGKLATSGAASASAGVTVTNGYGNVNGVVATERQASISGGTTAASASTLTMNDNGARFSNAATGAPVTVTGVADGRNDFDAVNVRQFAGAVAAVAAQANIPALAAGQDKTIGLGVGNFMGKTGLALGMNLRGEGSTTFKLSVSTGLNGGAKTVIGGGAAWSF